MFGAPYDPDVSVKGLYAFLARKTEPEPCPLCEFKGWPAAGRPERFVRVPRTP